MIDHTDERARLARLVPLVLLAGVTLLPGPALVAQQAAGEHTVRPGDTLWDLADRYLSDPFRWPDIYHLNADVVADPHWIYPGEHLRLPGQAVEGKAGAPAGAGEAAVAARPLREAAPRRRTAAAVNRGGSLVEGSLFAFSPATGGTVGIVETTESSPSPLITASDFYRVPFLVSPDELLSRTAVAVRKVEENPQRLSLPPTLREYDQVILALQGLRVAPGELLQAGRGGRNLPPLGRVMRPMALLEVTRVDGDSARAVVRQLFGDFRVGDVAIPAAAFSPHASSAVEAVVDGAVAVLVGFGVAQDLLGMHDPVFLNVGAEAGVQTGDSFAVFSLKERDPQTAAVEDRLATLRVVRVGPDACTAVVVELRDPGIVPGVPARLIARAPKADQ